MIGYAIPLNKYPTIYNGQPLGYAGLSSQKNYISLYLMNISGDKETEQWFTKEYAASGKKLNMGNRAFVSRRRKTCLSTLSVRPSA